MTLPLVLLTIRHLLFLTVVRWVPLRVLIRCTWILVPCMNAEPLHVYVRWHVLTIPSNCSGVSAWDADYSGRMMCFLRWWGKNRAPVTAPVT